jgi:hypothetical protein
MEMICFCVFSVTVSLEMEEACGMHNKRNEYVYFMGKPVVKGPLENPIREVRTLLR